MFGPTSPLELDVHYYALGRIGQHPTRFKYCFVTFHTHVGQTSALSSSMSTNGLENQCKHKLSWNLQEVGYCTRKAHAEFVERGCQKRAVGGRWPPGILARLEAWQTGQIGH